VLALAGALLVSGGGVVLVANLVVLAARPALPPPGSAPGALELLRGLPGPSPLGVAILVPAAVLLGLGLLLAAVAARASRRTTIGASAINLVDRTAGSLRIGLGVMLGVVASLALLPVIAALGGYTSVTLTSGSMGPSYPAGSLLLVEHVPVDQLALGDIVAIRRPALDALVTHRIIGIERALDGLRLQTRGDTAPAADPGWTNGDAVEGRLVTGVRALGGLREWSCPRSGFWPSGSSRSPWSRGSTHSMRRVSPGGHTVRLPSLSRVARRDGVSG
jgi:signal peptidase I